MSVHYISGAAVIGLGDALAWRDSPPTSGLVSLPWFAFEVQASSSCRRTAARIARRAERAYWFLRRSLDVAPQVRLLVLDRTDWPLHAERD